MSTTCGRFRIEIQMKYSDLLRSYYVKKRKEGKHFSMRAMAKKLGISSSHLSYILQGQRHLPLRLLEPLSKLLDIDSVDRDRILREVLLKSGAEVERAKDLLSLKQSPPVKQLKWDTIAKTDFIADWADIAIFLCAGLSDYDGSPEFVANRLFLELGQVNKKMKALVESGFLQIVDGKMIRGKKTLQMKSGKDFSLIRKYHKAHLDNASWSLEHNTEDDDLANRLITGLSFTVSKKMIPRLKQKIQNFILEMAEESIDETPDEVYQLAVQLFPLSKKRAR